ncbi:MAG TPA: O-methyltransferase [Candidatus Thermoplasmatota archaeon]|nr:O-methyltransferase [Candidatus Thermoplasmatota archaeon]
MSGNAIPEPLRDYIRDRFAKPEQDLLRKLLAPAERAGLPPIMVEPEQARLLRLLVRLTGARRVLDVGTLFGYSAAALAGAGPDVAVTSLEYDPRHAEVARANLAALGLAGRVEVLVGDARQSLPTLQPPYDLALVDADKTGYRTYWEECLRLVRPGGAILVDNVFAFGKVLDDSADADVQAVQAFNDAASADPRVEATILPVGDGLLLAHVLPR